MKGLVVTTFAVIGLQGIAVASTRTEASPASAVEKYAPVQESGKGMTRDTKIVPAQVASRLRWSSTRIYNACDDNGMPCPHG
ncbi:hypothetical protein NLO72_14690 [Pseudomonas tremae]|uniref:hypothetical protein n=1 Tax=Pseudomonas syringae group TaxID=136849 RepID=UPI000F0020CD|nr:MULTISPECIES: hypothetical protein [Pseudomonas syringae group]MCQ2990470.1 hypothetical protein [Pseudomonas tremae]